MESPTPRPLSTMVVLAAAVVGYNLPGFRNRESRVGGHE
jgi:hypothetical protein